MTLSIRTVSPHAPEIRALIDAHNAFCDATGPDESNHYLTSAELDTPSVTLFGAWRDGALVGIGALSEIAPDRGEIKSMHTLSTARGAGVGRALLSAIRTEAGRRGYGSLWLETGSAPDFAPARLLYERAGFAPCPPFGSYRPDPLSTFYTLTL